MSRLLVTILIRVFAIPDIGYYGDYGFLAPIELAVPAIRFLLNVCALWVIALKEDKCRILGQNNFLGATGRRP